MVYGLGNNGEVTHVVYSEEAFEFMKGQFTLQVILPEWYDMAKHKYVDGAVEDIPQYAEWEKKNTRIADVQAIKVVTSSGKEFDGDEKSQERMLRAINIASITGQVITQWKLADNSIVDITLEELKEALSLSGQEMSRIWLS